MGATEPPPHTHIFNGPPGFLLCRAEGRVNLRNQACIPGRNMGREVENGPQAHKKNTASAAPRRAGNVITTLPATTSG